MSIRCRWAAPTKHTSGRPAAAGDLVGYNLLMRVDGAPSFTEIAKPAANVIEYIVDTTTPGKYDFQLLARSSNGKTSAAGTGSVTIADDTPLEAPALTVDLI